MNKPLLFSILTFLLPVNIIFAQQSLILSFEAMHYEEGITVALDSILIKNVTRNCDTTLYAPDTVLYYNFYVGLDNKMKNDKYHSLEVYPNPAVNNRVSVKVFLHRTGKLSLRLYDIYGSFITGYKADCHAGTYTFDMSIGKSGYYVLKSVFGNSVKTFKIVNNKSGAVRTSIKQASIVPRNTNNKSKQKNGGGFWYEPGDTLWLAGFAKTPYYFVAGSEVIEDVPHENKHYVFTIVEGLPCNDVFAVKYAGHLYPTVQIDGKCWFKENLNVGTMIPGDSNMKDNGIIEKYCYDNDSDNCNKYGGLYQWNEMMDYKLYEGAQGICPEGWHIPKSDELFNLIEDFDIAGSRERGQKHWISASGTNTKGFTAVGAGYRQNDKMFYSIKQTASFISSTSLQYDWVWYMEIDNLNHAAFGSMLKITGLSVRCIKDE